MYNVITFTFVHFLLSPLSYLRPNPTFSSCSCTIFMSFLLSFLQSLLHFVIDFFFVCVRVSRSSCLLSPPLFNLHPIKGGKFLWRRTGEKRHFKPVIRRDSVWQGDAWQPSFFFTFFTVCLLKSRLTRVWSSTSYLYRRVIPLVSVFQCCHGRGSWQFSLFSLFISLFRSLFISLFHRLYPRVLEYLRVFLSYLFFVKLSI